jgi:hypothetical protein
VQEANEWLEAIGHGILTFTHEPNESNWNEIMNSLSLMATLIVAHEKEHYKNKHKGI